ncbi:MAG: class I SAM-dependent methyltransferase [bacterium]|nr:class I SAM-dependent methyltransferase [bacterium]
MPETKGRLVVDIGCGARPVFVDIEQEARSKERLIYSTPLSRDFLAIKEGDRYIGIDRHKESIASCKKSIKEKKWSWFDTSKISFKAGDARSLRIATGSADVVLLSDILSAPIPGTTPVSEPYPDETCITEGAKWAMIKEALRILRDDGHLVIQICQTPLYAEEVMSRIQRDLLEKKRIKLVRQCGEFVKDSDNWNLYQAAFQKASGPFKGTPEVIPWTEAQKKFAIKYAASWDSFY